MTPLWPMIVCPMIPDLILKSRSSSIDCQFTDDAFRCRRTWCQPEYFKLGGVSYFPSHPWLCVNLSLDFEPFSRSAGYFNTLPPRISFYTLPRPERCDFLSAGKNHMWVSRCGSLVLLVWACCLWHIFLLGVVLMRWFRLSLEWQMCKYCTFYL